MDVYYSFLVPKWHGEVRPFCAKIFNRIGGEVDSPAP
jgi:hypothetical protein